eukprot:11010469-Heterocapsa_arctica.AAC.1
MQSAGMLAMFASLHAFRVVPPARQGEDDRVGEQRFAVIGCAHSWDETRQLLRQSDVKSQNPFCRVPAQRVGRTVLAQRALVHAVGLQHNASGPDVLHHRSETYVIPPLEMAGKSSGHLAEAFRRCAPLNYFSPNFMREHCGKVDAVVITFWGDAARSNK